MSRALQVLVRNGGYCVEVVTLATSIYEYQYGLNCSRGFDASAIIQERCVVEKGFMSTGHRMVNNYIILGCFFPLQTHFDRIPNKEPFAHLYWLLPSILAIGNPPLYDQSMNQRCKMQTQSSDRAKQGALDHYFTS